MVAIAEVATGLWFAWAIYLIVSRIILGQKGSRGLLLDVALGWFLYCVPIHIHGFIPYFRHKEMMNMTAHPDIYFGAYPMYCKADPRYCSDDIFIQMVQMGTALFVTPLCLFAFIGLWKKSSWRHAVIIVACAFQMVNTILFFVEPLHLDVNPIPTTGFDFYFAFLFMNNMWIWIPLVLIWKSFSAISLSQAAIDSVHAQKKPLVQDY